MKAISAKTLLKQKVGSKGTKERQTFQEEAFAYYFGTLLKQRRKSLKVTQAELAHRIGKKRPYISRVENGEDIRISNLLLVANALHLKLDLIPMD
jgi:DNA-binding XRE family transcriptional regulator